MRRSSWLRLLHLSLKRATARRPHRELAQLERLEDRTVPVVILCGVGSGALHITLDPGEMAVSIHAAGTASPVVVTVDGVDHVGDGTDPTNPGFDCDAREVTSILVDAESNNTENNLIDLSAVTGDKFTMLVSISMSATMFTLFAVTINVGLGNDTII